MSSEICPKCGEAIQYYDETHDTRLYICECSIDKNLSKKVAAYLGHKANSDVPTLLGAKIANEKRAKRLELCIEVMKKVNKKLAEKENGIVFLAYMDFGCRLLDVLDALREGKIKLDGNHRKHGPYIKRGEYVCED